MSRNQELDLSTHETAETSPQPARGRGRPPEGTIYRPDYAPIARKFFMLKGKTTTNKDLAVLLGVQEHTITDWIAKHDEFAMAVFEGRELADQEVVNALYERAVGAKTVSQKAFLDRENGKPVVVEVVEHHPPDARAASFWLRNRHPDHWKEKTEHEIGALKEGDAGITAEMPSAEAAQRYAALMQGITFEGEASEEEST